MLFPTHLLVGYGLGKWWGMSPYLAVVGAALPDVIDKSAATVGLFDLYQTVGHSVFVTTGILGLLAVDRKWTPLFVGWVSHLVLDVVHMVLNGRPGDVRFLAWPVLKHEPAVDLPPFEFAIQYIGTPSFILEIGLWIVVAIGLVDQRRST
ncbi:MAG: metal-dependent hydrolase [Halodesulfurarchaeum sp.]